MTRRRRSLRAGLAFALLLAAITVLLPAPDAEAAVVRPFGSVFSRQTNGSIAVTGNTMMSCPTSATNCAAVQAGTRAGSNNDFAMTFTDADNDPTTSRSSSANVVVPSGARVIYAGLFWGAARVAGNNGVAATGNANQIKLRTPGQSTYSTVTASRIDNLGSNNNDYSSYLDVTPQVQAAGSGTYFAADMSAATGVDRYAGWSLVVAFEDPSAPLRDLNVFNGYASVTGNETVDATISGFLTPPSGAVNAKIGSVTYEGDAGLTGDFLAVNCANNGPCTRLADAQSPSANFFGSRVTNAGANLANRNPANVNTLGLDAKVVDAAGVIPNSATSANLRFNTSGDFYYPAALTTQVDLYAPQIRGSKTVVNRSGNDPTRVGDTLEYTLNFANTGDDFATGSVVTDPLPAGTTFVPGSLAVLSGNTYVARTDAGGDDDAEYLPGSRQVRYRVGTGANATAGGTLATNASATVRFRVTVASAAAGTTLRNTGSLAYNAQTIGNAYTYATETVATPVATLADLSLTKTATPDPARAGGTLTYTLTAGNAGPTAATDVQVVDTLPEGVSLVSATTSTGGTCSPSGRTLTCGLGTVAPDTQPTVTVVVRVPQDSAATALTNVATISSSTSDPVPGNNAAAATSAITRAADIVVTKTADATSRAPGQPITYTITATNAGPSQATGVVVTDTVPSGVIGVTASSSRGSCEVTGSDVSCRAESLPAGASTTVTVSGRLDPSSTGGPLVNTARATSETADPTPGNNAATSTVTRDAARADLATTKTMLTSPVVPGRAVQYAVTVTNNGPSDARGVTLEDVPPGVLSDVRGQATAGSCTTTAGRLGCELGTIPAGGSVRVLVDADLAAGATGTLTNTATASATTADPVPGNDAATATSTIAPRTDLGLTKTADPVPAVEGGLVTYTMVVTNYGPSTATGVVVTDPVPPPLTFVDATATQGSCTAQGTPTTARCEVGTLAVGEIQTVRVRARVPSAGGADGVRNTARATSATVDPVPANDTATYVLPTAAEADVSLAKQVSPDPVVAGEQVTFVLTATNNGPSDASGVRVTDTVPASVTDVSATTSTPGASCAATVGNRVDCGLATLADGQVLRVVVTGTVAPGTAPGPLTNTGTVQATTPRDPSTANNTATTSAQVVASADLAVVKSGPARVVAGQQLTWTLDVDNLGPSTVRAGTGGAVVTDALPSGVSFVSGTGDGVDCTAANGQVRCALPTLAPSDPPVRVTIVGRAASTLAAGSVLQNNATVTSTVPDPQPDNDADTTSTTVDTRAELALTKAVAPSELVAGSTGTYTLRVQNDGPSSARDVVVQDTLDPDLEITSASFDGGTCAVSGQEVRCTRTELPAGADARVLVQVVVDAGRVADLTNLATVSSATPEDDDSDNTATLTTPVTESADVQVVKTASQAPVAAGTGLTYTLTVVNAGPSDASGTVLTDRLPDGLNASGAISTSQGTCEVVAGELRCALGTVTPGTPATVTLPVLVGPGAAPGEVTNAATVVSEVSDPDPSNNRDEVAVEVTASAGLSLVKTAQPESLVPGTSFSYSLVVRNAGPSTARDVMVRDEVPSGIAITGATFGSAATPCEVTGQAVRCAVGDLPVGQVAVTIDGALPPGFERLTVTNDGRVTSSTPDPEGSDNVGSVTSPVVAQADMSVEKTLVDPATNQPTTDVPAAGERVKYRLRVRNLGPSTARSPQLIDQLPAGLTNVRITPPRLPDGGPAVATCELRQPVDPGTADNPSAPTVFCTGPLFRPTSQIGGPIDGYVEATVASGASGVLSNVGRISTDTIDPVAGNNESTVDLAVRQAADLSVVKTIDGPPVPGESVTYTLEVDNAGPSTARGVVLTDALPDALTDVRVDGDTGSCRVDDGTVSCDLGSVAPAAPPARFTVTGELPADFTGALSNTASIDSATDDPVSDNDSSTVTRTARPSADVRVTKRLVGDAVAGAPVEFVVTVANAGPSVARDVQVVDSVPEALDDLTATADDGSTCRVVASEVTCELGDLAAEDDPVSVTIRGTLAADFTGRISNTARAGSATTPDPVAENDTATAEGDTAGSADTSVVKELTSGTPVPGETVTWTLLVDNAGPSLSRGVEVRDQLPAGLSGVTAQLVGGPTDACGVVAREVTCDLGDTAAGTTRTIRVSGTLDPDFEGVLANTAVVDDDTADPDSSNNTSRTEDRAVASADVSVVKTLSPTAPVPGRAVSFTLTVDNDGPSTARGVLLNDAVPAALTDVTATSDDGTPCAVDDDDLLRCPIGDLPSGAPVRVRVSGILPSTFTGDLVNSATVSATTPDPEPANDTDEVTGTAAPSADLAVVKTASTDAPVPGEQLTYSLAVTNRGPSAARDVVLTDPVPAALGDVTADVPGPATCVVSTDRSVRCELGTVPPDGPPVVVTVVGTLDADFSGRLSNTAEVASGTPDPEPDDNTDTVVGTARAVADVRVTKTLSPVLPVPGEEVTYVVTVANDGPSTARDVVLSDPLPAALSDVGVTGADCEVADDGVVRCALGDLSADADPVQVTITGTLDPDFEGTLSNTATAATDTVDSDPRNDSATAAGSPNAAADVSITKSADPVAPVPGEDVSWTLTVRNDGPSEARGVVVTDDVPEVVGNVRATASDGSRCTVATGGAVRCALGSVAPDAEPVTVTVTGRLAAGFTGDLANTAYVATSTPDPDSSDNSDSATGTAAPQADVSVVKEIGTADPVPGERVRFTLTVDNAGPSTARQVVVVDELPDGLSDATVAVTSDSGTDAECRVSGDGIVSCVVEALAPGSEPVEITVTALLGADETGTLSNTASVSTTTDDTDAANDTDTVDAEVSPSADLVVTKSLAPVSPQPGGPVTFTITVTNQGPSTATDVRVTDLLGEELDDIEVSADGDGRCLLLGRAAGCTFPRLPDGSTGTVTIRATLDPDFTGRLSNTAEAEAATPDPDGTDNADTVLAGAPVCPDDTDPALGCADLQLTKTASTNRAAAGDEVSYTLVTTNNGPSSAREVVVSDDLPDGLRLSRATLVGGEPCVTTGASVRCAVGRLLPGGTATVVVTATVTQDVRAGMLRNVARAETESADPVSTNDEDGATIEVVSPATPGGPGDTPSGPGDTPSGPGAGPGGDGGPTGTGTVTDDLPDTGAQRALVPMLGAGLVSLALGIVLLVVRRRREA
ncbi:DUF7507 domain-containing protein [Nocardioides marmoraquaticus]